MAKIPQKSISLLYYLWLFDRMPLRRRQTVFRRAVDVVVVELLLLDVLVKRFGHQVPLVVLVVGSCACTSSLGGVQVVVLYRQPDGF